MTPENRGLDPLSPLTPELLLGLYPCLREFPELAEDLPTYVPSANRGPATTYATIRDDGCVEIRAMDSHRVLTTSAWRIATPRARAGLLALSMRMLVDDEGLE